MTSIADIAREAFDGVAAEMDGVIKPVTLTRTTENEYDPATGTFTEGSSETTTGRAVFGYGAPVEDVFPAHTIGPAEEVVYLEGLRLAPKEAESIEIDGRTYTIKQIKDVVQGQGLYAAVVV